MNTLTRSVSPANPLSSPLLLPLRFREPENLRWGRFPTVDGAELRWAHMEAANPRMNCLLVGGYSEFIEKYFETARDLSARGISVWCLDWRGQGGSTRDKRMPTRPLARDFDRDAADLTAYVKTAMPTGALPRILIAHSMGGAIALLSLHAEPALVDAAILSAPMLAVQTGFIPAFAARVVAHAATRSGFGESFIPGARPWTFEPHLDTKTSLTSHDPNRCLVHRHWFTHHPHLRVDGLTYGWLDAAFALTRRLQRAGFLEAITTPLLIGSAGREFFVDPVVHHKAAARLPHCTLAVFPDAKHELFMEADAVRDRWLGDIDAFLAGSRAGHP
jgi:lysophospholipase